MEFLFKNLEDFVNHLVCDSCFTKEDLKTYIDNQDTLDYDLKYLVGKSVLKEDYAITCPHCGCETKTAIEPLESIYCLGCDQIIPNIHFQKRRIIYTKIKEL